MKFELENNILPFDIVGVDDDVTALLGVNKILEVDGVVARKVEPFPLCTVLFPLPNPITPFCIPATNKNLVIRIWEKRKKKNNNKTRIIFRHLRYFPVLC